jgi:hypothetical protein
MTYSVPRASAIALSAAALVSLSTLTAARADSAAETGPTPKMTMPAHPPSTPTPAPMPTAAAPSLSEPAPTPAWAESGPNQPVAQNSPVRHSARHHYAYRSGRRSDNPVATVAMGVAGGAADLGSVAAYPFYCFPNYGSCSIRVPYRY